jgi:Fe2+ or Zn2+ uptake regulation protein
MHDFYFGDDSGMQSLSCFKLKGKLIMEEKNNEYFISTLRACGISVTAQRVAIYRAMYSTPGHPTVETIHLQLKRRFPMISHNTVYNALEKFFELGLIQKVSPITEVARYDAVTGHRHYMVCIKCQAIRNADSIVQDSKVSEQNGFHIIRQQVFLHGYCPACRGSQRIPI